MFDTPKILLGGAGEMVTFKTPPSGDGVQVGRGKWKHKLLLIEPDRLMSFPTPKSTMGGLRFLGITRRGVKHKF